MGNAATTQAPIALCDSTLGLLPDGVVRPSYDRRKLSPGIVHIGLGNFHRAHQAWYLHRLMQLGEAMDWAIIGAGVLSFDEAQRQKMAAQDYLTTLIELDPAGTTAEVIGPMIGYAPIEDGNAPLIAQLADPAIRIVGMTVTEGGYYLDPATKGFDAAHPDIVHDAANTGRPKTAFGAMVAALRQRRDAGHGPFTCMSCDNIQANGAVFRQTVVSLARMSDPDLADWIDANCSFPNSMVDCIVPATGPNELALVRELGIDDLTPVTHENFHQWVVEDDFCAGRPALEKVGVTFSADVHAYETMKLRLLNACHSAIAESAQVLGVETIAGCLAHPRISAFLKKLSLDEIAPTVDAVPEYTPTAYADLIYNRFSNPKIVDTTRRVASDGSSKHPGFIQSIIHDQIAAGRGISGLTLVEAAWARMCEGTREDGSAIEVKDPMWDDLQKSASAARNDPAVWTSMSHLYGDLSENAEFSEGFARWLGLIWEDGLEAALTAYAEE